LGVSQISSNEALAG